MVSRGTAAAPAQDVCGDVRWAQEAGIGAAAAAAADGGGLGALEALERGVDNASALVGACRACTVAGGQCL